MQNITTHRLMLNQGLINRLFTVTASAFLVLLSNTTYYNKVINEKN